MLIEKLLLITILLASCYKTDNLSSSMTPLLSTNDKNENTPPSKPVITTSPSDVFSVDSILEFTCQARGYPKPTITWHDAQTGQQVIDRIPTDGSSTEIHVNQHYGKLLISNPMKEQIYTFYCNASNSLGWVISQPPVRGGLAYLKTQFRRTPLDKTVHEGDRVLIECSAPEGLPEPKVYWLKNGDIVAIQQDTHFPNNYSVTKLKSEMKVSDDGSLQIHSVRSSDSGWYQCVAGNLAGEEKSASVYLTVKTRARFLETPVDIRVKKGRDAKFRCRVEGNHIVQWKRGPNEPMIDPTRAELTENYLLIRNVQPSDSGTYVCTAPGSIEANAQLSVDTPPAFSKTPDDLTVTEGETAIFHCVTTGNPLPAIYWELPDKSPIFPGDFSSTSGSHHNRYYLDPNGSLEIRNVGLKDAGKYQCTAHSSIDTIHTSAILQVIPVSQKKSTGHLDSQYVGNEAIYLNNLLENYPSQNFYHIAPIIGLPPANQTRNVGDLVTLDCELGTTREPTSVHLPGQSEIPVTEWSVSWQRSTTSNNGVLESLDSMGFSGEQRYSQLLGGSLQILDVQFEDAGNYTCIAKAFVNFNGDVKPTLLQSNWTAQLNVVPRNSLIPNPVYQDNPLSPPRNLRVTNVTSTTVTLLWEPSNWQQSFTSLSEPSKVTYWVELYRPDQPNEGWLTVEQNWHVNTVQLGGLQPNTAYYFLIRPRWSQGRVGWSSAPLGPIMTLSKMDNIEKLQPVNHIRKPLLDRETAQNVKDIEINKLKIYALSPRRVRVSWSVMDSPHILALITGYTIYYREVPLLRCISSKFGHLYLEPQEQTEPKYMDGAYCSIRLGATKETQTIPDILHRMEAMQKLHQELNVLQNHAHANSSSIFGKTTNIKANYLMDHQDDLFGDPQHSTTYQESGLLRDLDPFRCYEVKVKAYSKNSIFGYIEGRESISRTVLTYESFPSSPPEKIFATWLSNSTIELAWHTPPVTSWNGFLVGYIIYVYDDSAQNHQTFNVSYPILRTIINDLSENKVYLIQMAAITCKGVGVRSEPLRLHPELRHKGLGIGWGFDAVNEKLLTLQPKHESQALSSNALDQETSRNDGDNDKNVTNQPWFILTIIFSLLIWCGLIVLLTFYCRRQRYIFQKSAGAVLIANTSHCGSVADATTGLQPSTYSGPSTNNMSTANSNSVGNVGANKQFLDNQDQYQLEPLIKTPKSANETDHSLDISSGSNDKNGTLRMKRNFSPNQPPLFTVKNNSLNDQHNSKTESADSSFTSFPHAIITLPICMNSTQSSSPGIHTTPGMVGNCLIVGAAGSNNGAIEGFLEGNRTVQVNPNIHSNPMEASHLVYPGPIHFPPQQQQQPAYFTYQSNPVSQAQINVSYPSVNIRYDEFANQMNRIYPPGGLPLIAPVAQIDSIQTMNNQYVPQSSVIESTGDSSVSVAPYASVSIVPHSTNENAIPLQQHNFIRDRKSNYERGATAGLLQANTLLEESVNGESQSPYESGELLDECSNLSNPYPNCSYLIQSAERVPEHSTVNTKSNIIADETDCYQICTSQLHKDNPQRLGTNRSKSNSTTSGSLNNEEDRIQRWKKQNAESLSGGSGNISNGSFSISTNPFMQNSTRSSSNYVCKELEEVNDPKRLVYVNGMIPPPPESPPPPAPGSNHIQNHKSHLTSKSQYPKIGQENFRLSDASKFTSSSNQGDCLTDDDDRDITKHIYDSNFEEIDEDLFGSETNGVDTSMNHKGNFSHSQCQTAVPPKNSNLDHDLVRSSRITGIEQEFTNSSSFYMGIPSDEPSSSTYAQVY